MGVWEVFGITVGFNAKVVEPVPDNFDHHERIGGVDLYFGAEADGVSNLPPHTAFWVASADCPTVVLTDGDRVLPFHAGRDSVAPRYWIPEILSADRGRASVVDTALGYFNGSGKAVRAFVLCGIGHHSFIHSLDDPKWGDSNRRLVAEVTERWGERCIRESGQHPNEVSLSMPDVIQQQLVRGGVPGRNVKHDGIDTRRDEEWWSQADGEDGRNAVLIAHA